MSSRNWMVTAGMLVIGLGFAGFVAVVVSGHAPQDVTEKVRETVRDAVNHVVKVFKGSHVDAPVAASSSRLPADISPAVSADVWGCRTDSWRYLDTRVCDGDYTDGNTLRRS
jgi:hypothetical protein